MRSLILITFFTLLPLALSTTSSKRGLCHVPSPDHPSDDTIWTSTPNSDLTWYYNYKYEPSSAYASILSLQYVPMLWGASDSDTGTPFLDSVTAQIKAGANISYVLGFNEPDGTSATGGSQIEPGLAARTWIREVEPLRELGVRLGAPAVTGSPGGWEWLVKWFEECKGGCNPDFMPVHWYGGFEGLASHVGQAMGTYPNMTIWVTEYGYPNQNLKDTQSFFNTSMEWFDRIENITHYSYFGAFRSSVSNIGPNSAMLTQSGKLTDIGSWYLGGVATNNIPNKSSAATSSHVPLHLCFVSTAQTASSGEFWDARWCGLRSLL
ncbi:glycosyl hydrolase catalytic core-domain-containing protein [Clohesyomyces aquaticus]|uniref:Glycosyl hydrolase catalytic core-domain-containing protein n=1 Tax=Clohesyomyces aquaticus TaxID=1231657 RepID=A0A1Y2A0H5_9PLEO|nr:glycosyl hydrolase catalytic core-domain-containing protein [Clohesyomyces aquaticus]